MSDSYRSDLWILDIFEDWFDPCPYLAEGVLYKDDGLMMSWPHKTYCNPPYSNPRPWVEKAIYEHNNSPVEGHKKTIVLLLKHDTSTKWYQMLHEAGAKFLMVHGRLKFQTGSAAPFPSVLCVLGATDE